jgi:hypothetical protein
MKKKKKKKLLAKNRWLLNRCWQHGLEFLDSITLLQFLSDHAQAAVNSELNLADFK